MFCVCKKIYNNEIYEYSLLIIYYIKSKYLYIRTFFFKKKCSFYGVIMLTHQAGLEYIRDAELQGNSTERLVCIYALIRKTVFSELLRQSS